MTIMRRMWPRVFALAVTLGFVFATSLGAPQPTPNEFKPIDQLPPSEQLPSAPLLVVAYAFVGVATIFYVWTIWRRLNKVESELRGLEQKRGAGSVR